MSNSQTDSALLRTLLVNVVSLYTHHPERIECKVFHPSDALVVFQLQVETNDHRKVLGSHAQSLRALQTVFRQIGEDNGLAIDVRLAAVPFPEMQSLPKPTWDESTYFAGAPFAHVLEAIFSLMCKGSVKVTYQNSAGITAYHAIVPIAISAKVKDALSHIVNLWGSKVRRKLYIDVS